MGISGEWSVGSQHTGGFLEQEDSCGVYLLLRKKLDRVFDVGEADVMYSVPVGKGICCMLSVDFSSAAAKPIVSRAKLTMSFGEIQDTFFYNFPSTRNDKAFQKVAGSISTCKTHTHLNLQHHLART